MKLTRMETFDYGDGVDQISAAEDTSEVGI